MARKVQNEASMLLTICLPFLILATHVPMILMFQILLAVSQKFLLVTPNSIPKLSGIMGKKVGDLQIYHGMGMLIS